MPQNYSSQIHNEFIKNVENKKTANITPKKNSKI